MAKERIPLFGSIAAEFPSDYSLEESIERLHALLQRSKGWAASLNFRPAGKATAQKVWLMCVAPIGGFFGAEFRGRFQSRDGQAVLLGGFVVPLIYRAALVTYLILFGLAAAGCFIGWIAGNPWAGLAALLFLFLAALLTVLCRFFGPHLYSNTDWLAAVIARELFSDPAIAGRPLPVPFSARFCTVDCKTVLGLTWLLSTASAATGIRSFYPDQQGNIVFATHEIWSWIIVSAVSIITAVALVGLQRRTLFAWKCGLVGIPIFGLAAVGWLAAYVATAPLPQVDPDLDPAVAVWSVVAFFAGVIGLVITRRTMIWYKQKDLFVRSLN